MNTRQRNRLISLPFVLKVIASMGVSACLFYFSDFLALNRKFNDIAVGLNFFLSSSIIFSIGRYIIIMLYTQRNFNKSTRGNFVLGINRLTAVLNAVFAVIMIMIFLGIDPREFLTSMTIVAMAVAVTFREYITNMISGLIIMFSDQMSVGDKVVFSDKEGTIVDITLTNMVLLDDENNLILVPNNLFFTSWMVNKSSRISSLSHIRFKLPFNQQSDFHTLESHLKKVLSEHSKVVRSDEMRLQVIEIDGDHVRYRFDFYLSDNQPRLQQEVKNIILAEVLLLTAQPSELK